MSKEDVKKYFQMLAEDQEFLKKIIDTGEDKEAKMALVRSYGMDFTKEEFVEVAQDCKKTCEENGINIEKIAQELDDKALENVAGGGGLSAVILGGIFGIIGAEAGDLIGFVAGVGIASPVTAPAGLAIGALAGAAAGTALGAILPLP